jgi:hypothetical protein
LQLWLSGLIGVFDSYYGPWQNSLQPGAKKFRIRDEWGKNRKEGQVKDHGP